jgi:hypothetical protein
VGGSSRTLPDLSGRYLVGFGTDGGGDVDTAAWATAAVGNASHQINISHTHTGPSHNHQWMKKDGGFTNCTWASNGTSYETVDSAAYNPGLAEKAFIYPTANYYTNLSGTGDTGSAGSATQSIAPSSIRVRYIMRKA